ncbi:MAG: hypothetical protein H6852_12330 [Geminicoccaceae bacterium]|jgi:hypothetical protein|nr:hypothetical protein [Geminicoccaceae bacterium]MCB9968406.1 hypothetical protein [Geminicoccaceae bacterium]HRY25956.1 hypothetical protein [Geminicoccaceae bacterium]
MPMASRETPVRESDRQDATDDVEALLRPVPAGRPRWAGREFLLGALSGVALPVLMLAVSLGMWLLRGDISPDGGLVVRPAAWLLAVAALIAGLILALAVASFVKTRRQQRTNVALHEVVLTRLTRAEGSLAGARGLPLVHGTTAGHGALGNGRPGRHPPAVGPDRALPRDGWWRDG